MAVDAAGEDEVDLVGERRLGLEVHAPFVHRIVGLVDAVDPAFGVRTGSEEVEAVREVLASVRHVEAVLELADGELGSVHERHAGAEQIAAPRVGGVEVGLGEEPVHVDSRLIELVDPVLGLAGAEARQLDS